MKRLLATDLRSLLKSKLTLIGLIIAVTLPLLIVLVFVGIRALMKMDDPEMDAFVDMTINAKTVISTSFSLTSNVGIVLPVFSGIIVGFDLTAGTIRNKLIAGCSRTKVYCSHLIVATIFNVGTIAVYAGALALFSLIMMPYGPAVTQTEALSILYFYILGFLSFIFMATLSTFFALAFASMPLTIILTIATGMLLGLLASILGFINYDDYKYWLNLVPGFASNLYQMSTIDLPAFLEGAAIYIFLGGGLTAGGIALFNNKDLK